MPPKRKTQQQHARKRFSSRFGITLNDILEQDFINKIKTGEAKFIEKQSNRISVFEIQHGENTFHVVYDRKRKVIVTCLHPDGRDVWQQLKEGK